MVGDPEAAPSRLVERRAKAADQGIGDGSRVAHLADDVLVLVPGPQDPAPTAVAERVGDQLVDGEDEPVGPLGVDHLPSGPVGHEPARRPEIIGRVERKLIGLGGLDLAVLPIGDLFTMGPDDSIEAVKFLSPKRVAPCHYNTWPDIEQDAAAWAERVRRQTAAEPIVVKPGESFKV